MSTFKVSRRATPMIALCCAVVIGSICLGADDPLPTRMTPVADDQKIPTTDFLRPFLFSNAALSPSGSRFAAYIENQNLGVNVLVCDIASGKTEWTNTGHDVTDFAWLDDNNLYLRYNIFQADLNGRSTRFAVDSDRKVGSLDKPTPFDAYSARLKPGVIAGTNFIVNKRAPTFPEGNVIQEWSRPEDGAAAFCLVQLSGGFTLYRSDGSKWLKSSVDTQDFWPIDLGSSPEQMIGLGPRKPGVPRALLSVNTLTGAYGPVVYQDARYDEVTHVIRKPGYGPLIGVAVPRSAEYVVWFDPARKRIQSMINGFFRQSFGIIAGADQTETRFLIKEVSDIKPDTYYMLDLGKSSIGLLKNEAPWIDPKRMRPTKVISYSARDGSPIEAYLTMPDASPSKEPPPLVVFPHFGPWTRTLWGWNGVVQLLANRGYAVLQPNYRGSVGYDSRFGPDDRWDFGKMSTDVTDGAKAMASSGLIDSKRIAIMGTGFGGYLSVCGAVDNPGLYRCVVTIGGVFDWEKAFLAAVKNGDPVFDELRLHLGGGSDTEQARFAAFNPLLRMAGFQAPILIANNASRLNLDDITANYGQVSELARSLPRNVPQVLVGDLNIYSDNQAFSSYVDWFDQIQLFLALHLGKGHP